MSTQRRKGLRSAGPEQRPTVGKVSARRFPVQYGIDKLEGDLNAYNERIAELEDEEHYGHAMKVLKANAMDLARRIDELRSLLVESNKSLAKPKKKDRSR